MVVAAPENKLPVRSVDDLGYIRVLKYNLTSNQWKQIGSDFNPENTWFFNGIDVSISANGTIIAIGETGTFSDEPFFRESYVSVYELNSSTEKWKKIGSSISSGVKSGTSHSLAMSTDGKTIAVGASYSESNDLPALGRVRVQKYSSSSKRWRQIGQDLVGNVDDPLFFFGDKIAMSAKGTTIAVMAESLFVGNSFSVQVFKYMSATKMWKQVGNDIVDQRWTRTDVSISADGKTVAIGGGISVRVLSYTGVSWEQVGLNITGGVRGDEFGTDVSLSSDGTRLAVGAPANSGLNFFPSLGFVQVYDFKKP